MTQTDESFLDDLFEECVTELTEGRGVDLAGRLVGREHLEPEARRLFELAGSTVVGGVAPRKRLGDYEILRELGHGASGTVYLARQERLGGRPVALKVLARAAWLSASSRSRFLVEARALARLRHPNIVTVFDVVDEPGFSAYSMEWIEGITLAAWIRGAAERASSGEDLDGEQAPGRRDPVPFVCRLGASIGRALEEVHREGLLHRDVKPSNILLRRDGTPLLSDFGLVFDAEASAHTRTGAFLGTVAYAAPEQLRGESIDGRADVYGLGVTLYNALTRELPFRGGSSGELLRNIESGAAVRLRRRNAGLPRDLEVVVATAMDPDPDGRYPTALALAEDLERILSLRPVRAQPAGPVRRAWKLVRRNRRALKSAIAGGVAASLLVTGFVLWSWHRASLPERMREQVRAARLELLEIGSDDQAWMTVHAGGARVPMAAAVEGADDALFRYDAAIALDAGSEEVQLERAVVAAFAAGGLSPREAVWTEPLELTSSALAGLPDPPSTPASWAGVPAEDLRAFGIVAFLSGDLTLAVRSWRTLEREDRLDPFIEGMMGQLLLLDGRPALAYPRLLRAAEAFPEAGLLWLGAADAAVVCGDTEVAERLLEREVACERRARDSDRIRVRADLAWSRGDLDGAQRLYDSIHNDYLANLRRGQLAEARGDPTFAIRNYMQNVRTYSRNLSYRRELLRGSEVFWSTYSASERRRVLRSALDGDVQRYGSLLGLANLVDSSRRWLIEEEDWSVARPIFQVRGAGSRDAVERFRAGEGANGWGFVDLAARIASLGPAARDLTRLGEEQKDVLVGLLLDPGGAESLAEFWGAISSDVARGLPPESRFSLHEIREVHGPGRPLFGDILALPGDLDGDGRADLLVADRGLGSAGGEVGWVGAFSGESGELLYAVEELESFDDFGASLDTVGGDLDGDGALEWVAGAPQIGRGLPGYVDLLAGANGEVLRRFDGPADGDLFGMAVAGIGCIAGDEGGGGSLTAFVVGAPGVDGPGLDAGRVFAYAVDGRLLWERSGSGGDFFGESLVNLGDLDGDGVADVAAGTFNDGTEPRYVLVLSGRTGETLHRVGAEIERISFPVLGRTGDVDGDGVPDFAVGVGHDFHLPRPGRVHLFSGRTGELLYSLEGTRPFEHHCLFVNGVGDLDGDGREEIAVTSWNPRTLIPPTVHLYSGEERIASFPGWQKLLPLVDPDEDPAAPRRWVGGARGLYSDYLDPLRAPDGKVVFVERAESD